MDRSCRRYLLWPGTLRTRITAITVVATGRSVRAITTGGGTGGGRVAPSSGTRWIGARGGGSTDAGKQQLGSGDCFRIWEER